MSAGEDQQQPKRGPGRPPKPKDPDARRSNRKRNRVCKSGDYFTYLLKIDPDLWAGIVEVAREHHLSTARLVETILRAWLDKWRADED